MALSSPTRLYAAQQYLCPTTPLPPFQLATWHSLLQLEEWFERQFTLTSLIDLLFPSFLTHYETVLHFEHRESFSVLASEADFPLWMMTRSKVSEK